MNNEENVNQNDARIVIIIEQSDAVIKIFVPLDSFFF